MSRRPETLLRIDRRRFDAFIFDLDGVLTDTARLHARAWKETFDEFLEKRSADPRESQEPFRIRDDYLEYVDGKSREDGVRSFLKSRRIDLPAGSPDQGPEKQTVVGLARRKNRRFLEILMREGAETFPDTVRVLNELRGSGFRLAVISASRNARTVLESVGLQDRFAARVDGKTAAEEELAGKPAPDVFLAAARRLNVEPARTVVVEDSIAGVEAARHGEFGWTIGISRDRHPERILKAGADLATRSLDCLQIFAGRATPIEALPSAREGLKGLLAAVGQRPLVLCLDFDGTLSPIVDRPEEAELPAATREVLARLAGRRPLAILSGRGLDDLRRRVDLDSLYLAGSHGFRLAAPGGRVHEREEGKPFLNALDRAQEQLEEALGDLPGVQVERKRYSVAVHYRRAGEEAARRAEEATARIAGEGEGLKRTGGKMIHELRPEVDWHKGRALEWLLDILDLPNAYPLYLGDDETDEDAFAAVRPTGSGILVRGRSGSTAARFALEDPQDVRCFLEELERAI